MMVYNIMSGIYDNVHNNIKIHITIIYRVVRDTKFFESITFV